MVVEGATAVQTAVVGSLSQEAAAVGLVAFAVAGTGLVPHVTAYIAVQTAIVAMTHVAWHRNAGVVDQALGGLVMAVVFAFGAWLMTWMTSQARAGEERYRSLFRSAPVPLWECDFSRLVGWLGRMREAGITDLERHFARRPADVVEALSLVRVSAVNDAAAAFLGVDRELGVRRGGAARVHQRHDRAHDRDPGRPAPGGGHDQRSGERRPPLRGDRHLDRPRLGGAYDYSRVMTSLVDVTEPAKRPGVSKN